MVEKIKKEDENKSNSVIKVVRKQEDPNRVSKVQTKERNLDYVILQIRTESIIGKCDDLSWINENDMHENECDVHIDVDDEDENDTDIDVIWNENAEEYRLVKRSINKDDENQNKFKKEDDDQYDWFSQKKEENDLDRFIEQENGLHRVE